MPQAPLCEVVSPTAVLHHRPSQLTALMSWSPVIVHHARPATNTRSGMLHSSIPRPRHISVQITWGAFPSLSGSSSSDRKSLVPIRSMSSKRVRPPGVYNFSGFERSHKNEAFVINVARSLSVSLISKAPILGRAISSFASKTRRILSIKRCWVVIDTK